ncbi:glycosyltransferase [Bacteroidota bacterium]
MKYSINDKILVFSNYKMQKNSGGPSGYLYKCILENTPTNVVLLHDELKKNKNKVRNKIKNKINYWCSLFYNNNRNNHVIKFIASNCKDYKYLYFHDVFTLSSVLHLIKKNQIVVLQSHSPELPSKEIYNANNDVEQLKINQSIEKKSFGRADVLIFPNKNCESIYRDVIKKNHCIKYLITGIKKINSKVHYPLESNYINLLYIGRRNDIKGFNTLIEVFKKAAQQRKDLRLFIAGGGKEVDEEYIFDLGTVSTAYDWINSVDFVFSLNKQSYFDLNVIETICLGTPLIMSTTEGHEFFKNRKGIIDVSKQDLLEVLLDKELVSKKFKKENKIALKNFYSQYFTSDTFRNNLENICDEIMKSNI